jgi:hypothetical protein
MMLGCSVPRTESARILVELKKRLIVCTISISAEEPICLTINDVLEIDTFLDGRFEVTRVEFMQPAAEGLSMLSKMRLGSETTIDLRLSTESSISKVFDGVLRRVKYSSAANMLILEIAREVS